MRFFQLNPITRKRWQRFRRLKRGYYSLLVLVFATVLSMFSKYLANGKPIVVKYEGKYYFPTNEFHEMKDFGQSDADGWGLDNLPVDYRRLKLEWAKAQSDYDAAMKDFKGTDAEKAAIEEEFKARHNWLILPPIPWDPLENDLEYYRNLDPPIPAPHPPNNDRKHYLGTDSQGRDVASRLLYGFQISILFALSLTFVCQAIGTVLGSLQGYIGGWFDSISQRFIEMWATLPFLYVVMIAGSLPYLEQYRGFWMLLCLMALFQWMGITYYMRTEMYREKTREYCMAAKSYGASRARVVFRHLLPNCLTPLVTFAPFAVVGAIFSLTALDFLGYGLPAPTPSWGELIDQSLRSENRDKYWLIFSPFCAIVATLTLVTFVGESVREAFDPKQYAKYK